MNMDETPSDGDRLMPIFIATVGSWDSPVNARSPKTSWSAAPLPGGSLLNVPAIGDLSAVKYRERNLAEFAARKPEALTSQLEKLRRVLVPKELRREKAGTVDEPY